jgi:hypothetical protein
MALAIWLWLPATYLPEDYPRTPSSPTTLQAFLGARVTTISGHQHAAQ